MKNFAILFSAACFVFNAVAYCPVGPGCTCYWDTDCAYYCQSSQCRPSIPYGGRCSGNAVHPNECGSGYYCDPASSYTCQFKKSTGQYCSYSYSCYTGYCDYSTSTCRSGPLIYTGWVVPVIGSAVAFTVIFIVILVIIRVRRQRRMALGFYQTPCMVPASNQQCSYQNPYPVMENAPPAYPGPPKTYQSYS